jgi:choline dehydrogenase-like flavoprotein
MIGSEYDVVIVGSGIAGAIVAKTLCDAGKKVLLLDAGLESGMALDVDQAYRTQMDYLDTFYKAAAKAPNSPFPNLKNAPSSDVRETLPVEKMDPSKGYFVQKGPLAFGSDNWVGPGGTTQHWLGTALRMLPNDFQMHSMYGRAVDWPFKYRDLRTYYEMAEFEIGVAGEVGDQQLPNIGRDYFGEGGDYVFPMEKIPQSYLDQRMLQKTQDLPINLDVGGGRTLEHTVHCCSTPQGRNSSPNRKYKFNGVTWDHSMRRLTMVDARPGEVYEPVGSLWDPYIGQRCEGNASCVPICPVQAKYNALKTIKRAKVRNFHLLDIRSQSVAYELLIDPDSKKIQGVKFKRYKSDNGEYITETAEGTIYVLAASAIENAKLLLASGAANSSDQVGRNLMDHMCFLTWGSFPEPVYPFRGPGSTTNISSFRDGNFRSLHSAWICPLDNWGWGWPAFAPGSDVIDFVIEKKKIGKDLRNGLREELTRQVLLHFECEQDPQSENRITIDPKYKDRIGNYRPVVHYDASEYVKEAFRIAKIVSDEIFRANDIQDKSSYTLDDASYWEYQGRGYTSRGAGHIVGTHRMGSDPATSVVDAEMRTWDHKNLFLAGCGNMPTLGTSNPTLTMAALAFKSAEAILKQLEG